MGFASETRVFNTLFTATADAYVEEASVNLLRSTPLVDCLWKQGNGKVYDGGARIVGPARFGMNPNAQWYQGADKLNMDPFETLTRYAFDWKILHAPVTYTGDEVRRNRGQAQRINLVTERIASTHDTLIKVVDNAMAGDGTGPSLTLGPSLGRIILGLDAFCSTTPTADPASGAVGDIPAATNIWWQNYAVTSFGSFAANGPGGTASDQFLNAWNSISDGSDMPTLILSAQNVWEYYNRINLIAAQLVRTQTKDETADRTWNALGYYGRPWYWSRNIVDGRAFFLRAEDLNFWVMPEANLTMSEFAQAFDQDVYASHMILQCCFFITRRMFSAVLDGITA